MMGNRKTNVSGLRIHGRNGMVFDHKVLILVKSLQVFLYKYFTKNPFYDMITTRFDPFIVITKRRLQV